MFIKSYLRSLVDFDQTQNNSQHKTQDYVEKTEKLKSSLMDIIKNPGMFLIMQITFINTFAEIDFTYS